MTDPSTALRDPGLLRIGDLVEPSINGPFDCAQGAWVAEVVDRAAERSRSSTGGILLDGGPFDCAQGAWAKAIVILDADNRITFATRIAGAILGGFFRDAGPSTVLRESGRAKGDWVAEDR